MMDFLDQESPVPPFFKGTIVVTTPFFGPLRRQLFPPRCPRIPLVSSQTSGVQACKGCAASNDKIWLIMIYANDVLLQ